MAPLWPQPTKTQPLPPPPPTSSFISAFIFLISFRLASCTQSLLLLKEISSFIDFDCTLVLINLRSQQDFHSDFPREESAEEAHLLFPNDFLQHFLPVTILLKERRQEELLQSPKHRRSISRLAVSNCFQVVLNIPRSLSFSSSSPPLTSDLMSLISHRKNTTNHHHHHRFLLQNVDKLIVYFHHPPPPPPPPPEKNLRLIFSQPFVKSFKFKIALLPTRNSFSAFSACNFCPAENTFLPIKQSHQLTWLDFEANMNLHSLRLTASLTTRTRFNFSLSGNSSSSSSSSSYRPTSGILVHFLAFLQQNLNFTFTLSPVGTPGVSLPNGSWTGAVNKILRGDADIAICIAETYKRSQAATFSPTIFYEPIKLISGHPKRLFVWYAVLWPLSPTAWVLVVISAASSIALLTYQVKSAGISAVWRPAKILEYIAGSFLGQYGAFPENHVVFPPSILIFVTLWLFASFIITTIYLSMLVGFLTFPILEHIPETGDQLAANPRFSVGITYLGGALSSLMRSSKSPTIVKLAERMELTNAFQCIRNPTKDSRFICIGYEIIAKTFINTEGLLTPDGRLQKKPPVQIHPTPIMSVGAGVLMPDGSPLIPNVAETVGTVRAAGLVPQWERMEFRKMRLKVLSAYAKKVATRNRTATSTATDDNADEDESDILTFRHLHGAFILLLSGLAVSLAGLGIEFIFHNASLRVKFVADRIMRLM